MCDVIQPEGEEDHHHGSSDPLQWLRDAVPGEPGVDYPIYATIPPTSFSCDGRIAGQWPADPELGLPAGAFVELHCALERKLS